MRTIVEREQTIDCKYMELCEDYTIKCLACLNNQDTRSYYIDREDYIWYKKIRGEKLD